MDTKIYDFINKTNVFYLKIKLYLELDKKHK